MSRPAPTDRPVALVTGTTSGIGLALATGLAEEGFRVIMHCRNDARGARPRDAVRQRTGNDDLDLLPADLAVQDEVRSMADRILSRYDRLDVLVHNAGVYHPEPRKTDDGIEESFAVNHLAPFLVTHLLTGLLRATGEAHGGSRIVTVASRAHYAANLDLGDPEMERGYRGWQQYGNTKLMNILLTRALARRLDPEIVTANCFHPGIVRTRLARDTHVVDPLFQLFGKSVEKGADTGLWLATAPELHGKTGGYYGRRKLTVPTKEAQDEALGERLWGVSSAYTDG